MLYVDLFVAAIKVDSALGLEEFNNSPLTFYEVIASVCANSSPELLYCIA